ncbi:MAG: diaminopimelate epimerase [Acidobacteriota bacterium]
MTDVPFCKFHGFGNDYIVIEERLLGPNTELPDLAMAICHRHTGAGADGIAVLRQTDDSDADYFCEIVNPDGSIAGFSGNGTRCAAAYLYRQNRWLAPHLSFETRSGIKKFNLLGSNDNNSFSFTAEIGRPAFESESIPVRTDSPVESVIDMPIDLGGQVFKISAVNVGNPVACIFVEDLELDWRNYGRELETHQAFPERANIVFVRVLDRSNIELRIWERAAGETAASGTCSSGAAVLSAFTGRTERNVYVHSPGGKTRVAWRDDDVIELTGDAEFVYCGTWPG